MIPIVQVPSRYVPSLTINNRFAFKFISINHIQCNNYSNHIYLISDNHEDNYNNMNSSYYTNGSHWFVLWLEWNIVLWAMTMFDGISIHLLFHIEMKTNIYFIRNVKQNSYNISNKNNIIL